MHPIGCMIVFVILYFVQKKSQHLKGEKSQRSSPVLVKCIIKKEYDTFVNLPGAGSPKICQNVSDIAVLTEATKTPTMTPKDVEALFFERLEVLTVALL